MEGENSKQENRTGPKIRVSRDGKWLIIRVQGIDQAIIVSVNYLKAILESAEKRKAQAFNVEQIKG